MKALVYHGTKKVKVDTVDAARLEAATDVLVKVTSAAICGSDLHMYEGRTTVETGKIFGHEIMGVITEVGRAITQLKVGDRVVLPFNIACGCCCTCCAGVTCACLTLNPEAAGAAYGYAGMGPYQGGQAEFVRVPFGEFNCLKLPGEAGDKFENDFLMLADIFPTAFHATELANVKVGSTVAIYGAGPVGLLSALSCSLKGASEIYVIDHIPERLEKAQQFGAIAIDFTDGDPVDQITDIRKKNKSFAQAARPGEEKLKGVMCGIDAVGYQALDQKHPKTEKPTQVIEDLTRLVNPTGSIGLIGVFVSGDPGGKDLHAKKGEYVLPLGEIWGKGITIGMGQCPVKKYNYLLRDLIIAGKARPGAIVSHNLALEEAADAYDKFDRRVDGYTKVVLKPELS